MRTNYNVKDQYFLKDKKLQVYKKVKGGTDKEGYPLPAAFYPIAPKPIWAHARQLSQTDIFISMRFDQNETMLFIINFYRNIEVYDLVLYRGTWYRVTRAYTTEDYNREVHLYVENLATTGEAIPKEDQIKPYDPEKWK